MGSTGKTLYGNGYVRTLLVRMWQGSTDLGAMRDAYVANSTGNETRIQELTFPGMVDGISHGGNHATFDDSYFRRRWRAYNE